MKPEPSAEPKPSVVLHRIGGQKVASQSGEFFHSIDPDGDSADHQLSAISNPVAEKSLPGISPAAITLGKVSLASTFEVDAAISAADRAFDSYAALGPTEREGILLRVADLLEQRSDEFRELLIREIGSPINKADMEIGIAARVLRANASMARQANGRTYCSDVPGRWSLGFRRPLGIVAGITPFNVPLIKGVKHCSMPLALGNTYVWLPSPEAPLIADLLADLFDEAGLPPGAMNVVYGDGEQIGDALTGDPRISAVSFTGSLSVGRHVQARCGRDGKRLTLEMGGRNPLVVLADADLESAVAAAVRGGFVYQGQICMASSRVIVERSVMDEFRRRFIAAAGQLGCGDLRDRSTMVGPIINQKSVARIRHSIQEAVAGGAEVLCGNEWNGKRLNPTVLRGVTPDMKLATEEIFGPVVTLESADHVDQAIELANASAGMLSAAVFTNDLSAALAASQRLKTAMVHVNDATIQQEPEVPFGGDAPAGLGREGMQTGVDDYTTWKWVTVKGDAR